MNAADGGPLPAGCAPPGYSALRRIPSNPSERLGRREFADLLREARERYADHVVVDAPPLLGLSDLPVLLPQMDAVLFVVRYGVTHGSMAWHAMTRVETAARPAWAAS